MIHYKLQNRNEPVFNTAIIKPNFYILPWTETWTEQLLRITSIILIASTHNTIDKEESTTLVKFPPRLTASLTSFNRGGCVHVLNF